MQAKKPINKSRAPKMSPENNFYETMPMSAGSHYVYRDDVVNKYRGTDGRMDETYDATAKRVAIITLIVAAGVAIGIGILFAQGLSVINDVMPVNSNPSGSITI